MKHESLPNGPLREAIFELKWQVPVDETGFPDDRDFDFALGGFADSIGDKYPVFKRLDHPSNVRIFPRVAHQFWKGELQWPVVQFGPGILSVNFTNSNYTWEAFRLSILEAVSILEKSYKRPLLFVDCSLKYLNVYELKDVSYQDFISDNLQTEIKTGYEVPGKFKGITLNRSFETGEDDILNIDVQTVINNATNIPAILWTIWAQNVSRQKSDSLVTWLDNAHNNISELFVKMIKEDFYASFT